MTRVIHAGHVLPMLHSRVLRGRILRQRQTGRGKKCENEKRTDHGGLSWVRAPLLQRNAGGHMIAIMQTSISLIFQDARLRGLAPGETLFAAGEDVADIFLVRSGRVHLHRHTTHGAQMVLQNAGPGAVIAEASAYSSRYHCDAVAAGESVVAGLPKERFLSVLSNEPALAECWSALLARSVQAARLRSEIRSLPRVADRLDAWLGEDNSMPERGRWQEVAAELGITREALYRELARRRT
ncbi:Crp/Fnr family transcriptional regulator [Halovulum dunhuangense]|uniref:Crp/Fnr family transcriptional regulator n=1 Tax=Halovulum dunhuangense TaxID=1505036 RepID=A0A849L6A6_9RHOB|nr:Crp/Fnr family transcriptional regulator [Halovulum dunhuangense]NNU81684.1 Crp/Fnr family transcriptional regulator [Halovulum dunhuangense]